MAIPFLLPVAALLGANLSFSSQDPLGPFEELERRGTAETFLVMMQLTGLRESLETAAEPFTLLAPVDTAFSGVPPEVVARLLGEGQRDSLRGLLEDHVLPGLVDSGAFIQSDRVTARSGVELPVSFSGGRLALRGVPVASSAAGLPLKVSGGAVLELEGLILLQPSLLELTPARRLAARGLRLASETAADSQGAIASRCAVLEMSLAAALECANASERALLGDVPALAGPAPSAQRAAQLRAPLLRVLGRPTTPAAEAGNPNMTPKTTPDDDARLLLGMDGAEDEPAWFTLNDDVMGGISKSSVEVADGRLLFQGALSLENNGGFASIRSRADDYDLTGFTGLRVRVKTDGREYGLSALAGDERGRTGSWRKRFRVPAGEWATVDVPFSEMVLNVRGRQYPEVGPPKLGQIRSFSFIIGDKDTSPFQMEVDSISAYR